MTVLALDIAGLPRTWLSYEDAITYHAKGLVAWSLGDVVARFNGGLQKDGNKSYLETTGIIAVKGQTFDMRKHGRVVLTNRTLFARDCNVCAYCGQRFANAQLSRDHIMPRFLGGKNDWSNVVTSCKPCNQKKGCKTLKQSRMELLYIPYEPNHYENLLLQNRNILADQMEYLLSGIPKTSRVLAMIQQYH